MSSEGDSPVSRIFSDSDGNEGKTIVILKLGWGHRAEDHQDLEPRPPTADACMDLPAGLLGLLPGNLSPRWEGEWKGESRC